MQNARARAYVYVHASVCIMSSIPDTLFFAITTRAFFFSFIYFSHDYLLFRTRKIRNEPRPLFARRPRTELPRNKMRKHLAGQKKTYFRFLPRQQRRCGKVAVEIRSEEEDSWPDKKKGVKGTDGRREAVDEEKAVVAISGFSDGKFKTECELPLSSPSLSLSVSRPRGKADEGTGGDRVKILSYFRMTGLGLVSRLAFRYLILPRHA